MDTAKTKAVQFELEGGAEGLSISGDVSEDGLKLFLECNRDAEASGALTSYEELHRLLSEHVPEGFLHQDVIHEIAKRINSGEDASRRRVAKGKEAIPGKDGRVLLLVKPYKKQAKDREPVDPRFIRYFDNIEPGTVLARVYPPSEGEDGIGVLGETIAAGAGKEIEISFDETILRTPKASGKTYDALVSKTYGYLEATETEFCVREELRLTTDIDYRVGDVEFLGSVHITGDVMTGFSILARGNIEVQGNVVKGSLRSTTGAIVVSGTVTGDHGSGRSVSEKTNVGPLMKIAAKQLQDDQISAHQSVTLAVAEGASVSARGNIEITKEAHNVRLRTRAVVSMPQASLISGAAYAVCGFEARAIGSPSEEETIALFLCSDVESSADYIEITDALEFHTRAENVVSLLLGPFADDPAAIRRLEKEHREKMSALHGKLQKLRDSNTELEEKRKELLESAHYNSILRVNYEHTLYKGVRVHAGENEFLNETTLKGPGTLEFDSQAAAFSIEEQKPLECEITSEGDPKP